MIPFSAIQGVAMQIAERYEPQKIILFGSYVYGKPNDDSDVDYMVLVCGYDSACFHSQQCVEKYSKATSRGFGCVSIHSSVERTASSHVVRGTAMGRAFKLLQIS